jgi:hypothetical protein
MNLDGNMIANIVVGILIAWGVIAAGRLVLIWFTYDPTQRQR